MKRKYFLSENKNNENIFPRFQPCVFASHPVLAGEVGCAQAPRMHASKPPESTRSTRYHFCTGVTGLGLQKRKVCKLSGRLALVYIRTRAAAQNFSACYSFFRILLVGGWILPELGENCSCRNQKRKNACKKSEVRILCGHLAWIYIRTRLQPQFSLPATDFSQAVWLGTRVLHFSAAQDLARKS
jgi:hypothetical protein